MYKLEAVNEVYRKNKQVNSILMLSITLFLVSCN